MTPPAPTPLSQLFARARQDGELLVLDVPEDWAQGRSVFGGLQVVIALQAMRALVPHAPLRALQATFVAPVATGIVRARAQVLRSGKNVTQVEARLLGGAETQALVLGVFGSARPSEVLVTPVQPPSPVTEPVATLRHEPGVAPSFTQHFAGRWLRGRPPFSRDESCEHVVEVDLLDECPATEAHVVAIADYIAPLGLSHLARPTPGATATWMLELLTDEVAHLGLTGWRVDATLLAAKGGYTSQSVRLWAPDGTPVAIGQQCMLIFG